jgi:hypothetical protein
LQSIAIIIICFLIGAPTNGRGRAVWGIVESWGWGYYGS